MQKILLINPYSPPSKRRKVAGTKKATGAKKMATTKKRRTPAQIAATKRLVAANKKRKAVKRKTNPVTPSKAAAYRGVPTMKTNPIKRKRKSTAKSVASGTARKFRVRRRSNPINLPIASILQDSFMKSLIGAGGAVAVDAAAGFIPVPDMLKTGYPKYLYKGLLSGLAGVAAGYVLNKQQAAQVAAGGLTVAIYGALSEFVKTTMPGVSLGYYNASMPATRANLGAYVAGAGSTRGAGASLQASAPGGAKLGAYVGGSRQSYTGGNVRALR